jgi:hypothetical protein
MSLTKERNVLGVLDEELRAQGFAGSTDVAKLVFLSAYTRWFADPVCLVLKGPTSVGKSFALDAGLQFVPPAAFKKVNGMTDKALVAMGEGLKHRILVVREATGLANGTGRTHLRQLISDHRLEYVTSKLGEGGVRQTETLVVEGPIGLLMTTTENALHREDESRMLSYPMTSSPEKRRAAMAALMKKPVSVDTKSWFALHDRVSDGPKSVVIPRGISGKLWRRFPASHDRLVRDYRQVLNLIKAHALMHHHRKRTKNTVTATWADAKAVLPLVELPITHGHLDAIPEFARELVRVVILNKGGLSQSDAAKQLGCKQYQVSRYVPWAIDQGYLKNKNPGQGKTARLVKGNCELPCAAGELFKGLLAKASSRRAA